MAAVAMAVGATAGAARAVVDKVGEARARRIQLGAGEHSWRQVYNSADRAVCPIGATRL